MKIFALILRGLRAYFSKMALFRLKMKIFENLYKTHKKDAPHTIRLSLIHSFTHSLIHSIHTFLYLLILWNDCFLSRSARTIVSLFDVKQPCFSLPLTL